ncbi:thiolase-like protein [Astrocystis sublimbata]|nr:thiolase-like protein [Astrocystis sublimbata]
MAATSYRHVLLFSDQTDSVVSSIYELYDHAASKESALLGRFLQDASDICRIEFGNIQPSYFRDETPPFESLLEMAEAHAKTDGSRVFASCALSYFARLGELVLRTEVDATILTTPCELIGLCISLFPAALTATATSATQLARISIEGFPSYFALVVANHTRTKQIERPHGNWSYLVRTGKAVNELQFMLDEFHRESKIIRHKKAWISVVGRDWVTISGPPSTLHLLQKFEYYIHRADALTFEPLPVASAAHAPHLPALDIDVTAVNPSYIWNMPLREGASIMATDTCVPYRATTLGEVTQQIISTISGEPLMVDKTFTATALRLKKAGCAARLSVIGPSSHARSLTLALQDEGVDVDELTWPVEALGGRINPDHGAVAIVGMAGRFPDADNLDEFWDLLMEARTTHGKVPQDRFDLDHFYDPSNMKNNTMMNTDGCFLWEPGEFDARLFNMSPKEALQVDPTHRLLLMTSLEALEKAGYNHDIRRSSQGKRTAVYFGQTSDVWQHFAAEEGINRFTAPGNLRAFSPGRVSHHFGFEGGSYSIDSACSSSATAIQLARSGLINGECDMALAGGAQIAGSPFDFAALGKSGFLAPSGGCKTFRADADGYCRGEAVGVLVLKRVEDALADNDKIEALITGWGRSHSAHSPTMMHPNTESQEKLIRQVIRQANCKASDIGYVEFHGTGTVVGDLAEITVMKRIFGKHSKLMCCPPTYIGSLKANVGHSESAAGVSSVIKAIIGPPQVEGNVIM